jgi:hypothetical protein
MAGTKAKRRKAASKRCVHSSNTHHTVLICWAWWACMAICGCISILTVMLDKAYGPVEKNMSSKYGKLEALTAIWKEKPMVLN